MDIEEGAGNQPESGANMVYFVNKLRSIKPDIVIGKNLHIRCIIGIILFGQEGCHSVTKPLTDFVHKIVKPWLFYKVTTS